MDQLRIIKILISIAIVIITAVCAYFWGKNSAKSECEAKISQIEVKQIEAQNSLQTEAVKANTEVTVATTTLRSDIGKAIHENRSLPAVECKPSASRLQLLQRAYSDTNAAITGR